LVGRTLDVGAYEQTEIVLVEVDAQGRTRRREVFATGQLGHAVTRLYELYAELLPDGPARTRAGATARSVAALPLAGPHTIDRLHAVKFAPAFEYVDHRGTVGMGSVHGAEAMQTIVGALLDLMNDSTVRTDDVLALRPDALLVRWTYAGTDRAVGGAVERCLCELVIFGADGLPTRWEQFDAEREPVALARFEGLTAGAAPVPSQAVARPDRRLQANAATANDARIHAAIVARDVDAIAAHVADRSEVVDHTTGRTYDRQGLLATWHSLVRAQDATERVEPLATLGDSLALCREWVSGSGVAGRKFDVGPYEIEYGLLSEVDTEGRRAGTEIFATDHLGDAVARLYERYAELLPDGPARARAAATARSVAAMEGPLDLDRSAASLDSCIESIDHRTLGT